MSRWAPQVLMVGLACGCGNMEGIGSRSLAHQIARSPERYIIAAVDVDPAALPPHAGSTRHGYDTSPAFAATTRARSVMRSLEREYGLREVGVWRIEPLHMQCVLLQIPAGADRMSVLTQLSHDPRLRLVQPLQTFATRTEDHGDR
jgi:hypothetical protein